LNALVSHCLEPNVGRLTPCDFPLAKINQQQLNQLTAHYDHAVEDIYPATAMQQGLLFQSDLHSSAYLGHLFMTFNGAFDSQKYRQAWQQVIALHEVFNTAFVDNNKLQLVLQGGAQGSVELPWHQQDLTDLSFDEQRQHIAQYRQQDSITGFDASKAPLTRVAIFCLDKDHWQVLWTYHHAIIDGWCLPLLIEQVNASYQGLPLIKPRPYRSHVARLESQNTQAAQDYCRGQLSGFEQPTPLPQCHTTSEHGCIENPIKTGIDITSLTLTRAETALVIQLARDTKTTVNVVMQAAWGYLLSAYSRETSVVFGTTVSGRPADLAGVEQMIGLFINTIPVRVDVLNDTLLKDWLQGLHQAQVAADEYSYLSLSDIQRTAGWSGKVVSSGIGLFDSLFVFENYPLDPMKQIDPMKQNQSGLALAAVEGFTGTTFSLTLTASLTDTLNIELQSQRARFDQATAASLVDHLHQLLSSMSSEVKGTAHRTVAQLSMLSPVEQDYLLNTFNANQCEFAPAQCIHQMFEQQAQANPNSIALSFDQVQLSYQQLNEKANQLAHYLREQGVKADT
ncbi:MAG: condensation domain-containing protein, partial [Psychrosphaera sp.]|nr:condensation domain-containing protein [Psychrosphaera sp.]